MVGKQCHTTVNRNIFIGSFLNLNVQKEKPESTHICVKSYEIKNSESEVDSCHESYLLQYCNAYIGFV